MNTLNRRGFLKQSLGIGLSVGVAGLHAKKTVGANEKLVVGLMGCGGRGTYLATVFAQRKDVEIAYLCDPDPRRFARARAAIDDAQGTPPRMEPDFRRMLEDKQVDAVINATPDHWHALGTILACQAGKHVYVEKPASHNIWEGRKMVEAARKYKRIVQAGTQTRSYPYTRRAVDLIRAGKLGKVHTVRVHHLNQSGFVFDKLPVVPVPDGMDYDMYCGPAEKVPYRGKSVYLLLSNFSGGEIFADAVHQLDVARWLIGKRHPKVVQMAGGILVHKGRREFPDTQTTTYEYDDDTLLVFQGSAATASLYSIQDRIRNSTVEFPDWLMCSTRIECFGTEAFMVFGHHGGGWQVFGPDGKMTIKDKGTQQLHLHIANFIDCIRSGDLPNADIEEGHFSAAMGHLSNISFRLGNRKLRFDGATETFPDDPEANKLLKRTYRKPWVIPDQV